MIEYVEGYKYQIAKDYEVQTRVLPSSHIKTPWVDLNEDGVLLIKKGFASDGPSGIAIDTKTFMRGAFAHDALYYLIRQKKLSIFRRKDADKELHRIILEDGMCKFRAWYVLKVVQMFGKSSARDKKEILTAP